MSNHIYTLYKTTNLINGKIYVGVHSTPDINDNYLGSGTAIKKAIKKYGRESFKKEILDTFDTPEEMYKAERNLVTEEFVNSPNTYNLTNGGNTRLVPNVQDRNRKISEAHLAKASCLVCKNEVSAQSLKRFHGENCGKDCLTKRHISKRRKSLCKTYFFIDPKGNEIEVHDLKKFCKENGLTYVHMVGVNSKRLNAHKGYCSSEK